MTGIFIEKFTGSNLECMIYATSLTIVVFIRTPSSGLHPNRSIKFDRGESVTE